MISMNEELVKIDDLGLSEEELFSHYDFSEIESEKITAPRYSYWHSVFRVFFRKKINIFILVLLLLVIIFSYIYPLVVSFDQYALLRDYETWHLTPANAYKVIGFSIHTLLGTGDSGASIWDSTWYGARTSISLAFICAAINMFIGVLIGALWGFSKKIDIVMTEVYNVIANVPYLLIVMVFVRILSPSFITLVFALTITGWLGIAYFIRTQVIIIRDREYNLASRCLGTSLFRIALKNILPFMTSVIVTLAAAEIPSYISYEVFLSYIGLGLSANEVSLGKLIEAANGAMNQFPWEFWSPVAIASIIAVVLYVAGQNLGDASDPRTHM